MSSLIALRGTGEVPLATSSYRGPTSQIRLLFHQVRMRPDDCNGLCFLWWPDGIFVWNQKS